MNRGMAMACIALCLPAAAVSMHGQPRIVLPQSEYDFGVADNMLTVEHVFEVRNEGNAPLHIGRLRACCGGSARISATEILPGSNAWLTVDLSLRGRSGPQTKSYYLASNDPIQPYIQARLTGTAVAAVNVEPQSLHFAAAGGNQPVTAGITIVTQADWRFRITNAVCASSRFAWEIARTAADRHEITVRTVPPLLPGATRGVLVLQTDSKQYPEVKVRLIATVPSDLYVVPSEILLALTDAQTPVTRYLSVRSRENRPFRILHTQPSDKDVEIAVTPLSHPGYRIEVRNLVAQSYMEETREIVLTTDHHETRRIIVPVRVVD